jgi:hypothetical protein
MSAVGQASRLSPTCFRIKKNIGACFQKKQPPETGDSFWTALAERSGDSAFV